MRGDSGGESPAVYPLKQHLRTKKESHMTFAQYTAPGLTLDEGKEISEVLQARLHDLNELHLSLKHATLERNRPRLHRRARDD